MAQTKQPITIAIVDGFKGENLTGVPNENYYWQTVNYLFVDEKSGKSMARNFAFENGREGSLNELVQANPNSKPNIVIVQSEAAKKYYERLGYNVVVFSGVITSENLDKLGQDMVAATQSYVYNGGNDEMARKAKLALTNMGNAAKKVGKI